MQLVPTATSTTPPTPSAAFVSQLKGPSNPMGGDVNTNADCAVASSLMAMWATGAASRPTTAAGIDQAFVGARLIATGRSDRSEPLFPTQIDHLFADAQVPHVMESSGVQLLEDVRRGATAVAFGSGSGAAPDGSITNPHAANTWYARSTQLGLPAIPDGHAVAITDYQASDDSFAVMDPLGQAPFRATSSEVSTFIDNLKSWGYPAGVSVAAAQSH